MPRRADRRLASVLFPVPLVPHSSTATLLRRSRILARRGQEVMVRVMVIVRVQLPDWH